MAKILIRLKEEATEHTENEERLEHLLYLNQNINYIYFNIDKRKAHCYFLNQQQEELMEEIRESTSSKLWNKNFFLLWQGQLVSALGDVVYEIALGFWVLAVTGSTAIMGSLMAASALPRVLVGPFAGVWVDRMDRKWILVVMDALRGIAIVGVAIFAFLGMLEIWMVFVAGILIGLCGAFFNPSAASVLPDLIPKEKLMKGNSVFSMIHSGSGILGSTGGGFMYLILGAPLMFLINGISYLFSAFTEIFIKVPKVRHEKKDFHFWSDMKEGFTFTWNYKGLRFLFLSAAVINFFASMGFVLILPLFQQDPALGAGKYGLVMGALTFGMFLGMVLLSTVQVPVKKRFKMFGLAAMGMTIAWALFPLTINLPLMITLVFLGGVGNSILNIMIQTITQLTIPQNMRGKVFGLLGTLSHSLTPLAMAAGGILGEFFPIPLVISVSFTIIFFAMVPMLFSRDFRDFIEYNPDSEEAKKEVKREEA